jgi:hypothetical protein
MDETSVNAKKRFKVLTAPDPGHVTPNDLALPPIRIEEMMRRIQVGRGKDNVLLTPVRPILYRQNGQLTILWDQSGQRRLRIWSYKFGSVVLP